MSRITTLLVVLGINAYWIVPAFADKVPLDVKTGLWEVTRSGHVAGSLPIPAEDLAKLPPDQRAKFEESIKKSVGDTHIYKECLIEEDLKRGFEAGEDCTQTVRSSSAKVMEETIECGGEQKISGTVRFEALSSKKVKGTVHMVMGNNSDMTVDNLIEAKWLGSDCGGVKPGDAQEENQ